MKLIYQISLVLLFTTGLSLILFTGCKKEEEETVTDIDGNVYHTITIGTQVWMLENLRTTKYLNGSPIANVTDGTEWANLTNGAYCDYENTPGNSETYGRLYNWYAVNENRGLAPEGWHIPSDQEWKTLEMFLGMSQEQADATGNRGTDEGAKLKETGKTHWVSGEGASNESGFTALPGGTRGWGNGSYINLAYVGYWWSSTESSSDHAWWRKLAPVDKTVNRNEERLNQGASVRCIKD